MKKTVLVLMLALPLFGCGSKPTTIKQEDAINKPKGPAPEFDLDKVAGGKLGHVVPALHLGDPELQ